MQQQTIWKSELEQKGYINDEAEILAYIMEHDRELETKEISQLLAMAGKSRLHKDKKDRLGIVWMKRAAELDPSNLEAQGFLSKTTWRTAAPFLDSLDFPPIRETDNRTTKKKIAEEYIIICRNFLEQADDQLDQLDHSLQGALDPIQAKLYNLMLDAIKSASELLKAAEEYEQSITGVFHTAAYIDELSIRLEQVKAIKKEWATQFTESTEAENEATVNAIDELNQMIGLETVKDRVKDYYQYLKFQKKRKDLGFQMKDELSLNFVLTGNPGTGKTTLSRLLARIFHELGFLPREEVIETNRSQLVGSFVGQTEENVRSIVSNAIGGVLFIDEAYSLKREGQTGNDYGQAAIDTLVSLMTGEEFGGKFAVILAGYPEEMRSFLDANPGLRSRFPQSNQIFLRDYTNKELVTIAGKIAEDNDYLLTRGAKIALEERLERERVDETFGNARTVHNLVLEAIFRKGAAREDNMLDILRFSILDGNDFKLPVKENRNRPLEKLDRLIGLHSLKAEMKTQAAFVKLQQMRRDSGLPSVPIQLHSVFTGNPGTGKTTVAKIYAELLKENGFLKRGHLVIASRADLVASYVGQTAEKTRKKVRDALGGVLFIDEAYSLLSTSSGDFGKEAIDTLVDEMTRHNENLVIVLAGYPKQMEALLEFNPGLRSRFKKFFHFPDYNTEELLEIMINYAETYQYRLSKDAQGYILESLKDSLVSGNGRFAANLIEEAVQAQSLRLSLMDDIDSADAEKLSQLGLADVQKALEKIRKGEKE
ncbi:stage V sporulation protein K [Bacillus sp. FJAT-18017]|uniref:AAA family ATPase n=1 Tax=Bacillus sp. FJAT-18017 TaxID=1705566 RepID=UPI0006ADA2FF|nr:AAA family ATPase [Bacillus sp. FJAT-18017]ALC90340.1 stage V sporulation protein K [Bacillus sp. FJAT-18017]